MFWKMRAEAARTVGEVHASLIVAWAGGETAGLLGVVTYFQGGPLSTALLALLAFAVVLLIARISAQLL